MGTVSPGTIFIVIVLLLICIPTFMGCVLEYIELKSDQDRMEEKYRRENKDHMVEHIRKGQVELNKTLACILFSAVGIIAALSILFLAYFVF